MRYRRDNYSRGYKNFSGGRRTFGRRKDYRDMYGRRDNFRERRFRPKKEITKEDLDNDLEKYFKGDEKGDNCKNKIN